MENKKDLVKIALAALILASATPVNGQADIEAHGIILAASCAGHGCPAAKDSSGNSAYYTPPVSNQNASDYSSQPYGTTNRPPVGTYPGSDSSGYRSSSDNSDNQAAVATSNVNTTLTEAQLLGTLSAQGRATYLGLDSEGKALAIQLASQDSYRDKNLAVKEAQRRMNERRGLLNR